jgi:hypothetical protein
MRSIIKMLGLAFFATLALSAFGASSASAVVHPLILIVPPNTYPQLILGLSKKVSNLVAKGGSKVECQHLLIHGLIHSGLDILLLLLWHQCTSAGAECNSAGEQKGLIHTAVLLLPRLLLSHLPGFLIQLDPELKHVAEFECGIVKVVVNGTVEAHLDSPAAGVPSNEATISVEVKTAGSEQKFTHDEGSNEIDHLESSFGIGFENATEEVLEAKVHLNTGVEAEFHC